jgi:hypothetical protein
VKKLRIVRLGLARRDRKGSLNDGRIQNPSNPFGIVPLSKFVPRGFGFVHHSIAILYHQVPNPNLTIRNFLYRCRAVSSLPRGTHLGRRGTRRREGAQHFYSRFAMSSYFHRDQSVVRKWFERARVTRGLRRWRRLWRTGRRRQGGGVRGAFERRATVEGTASATASRCAVRPAHHPRAPGGCRQRQRQKERRWTPGGLTREVETPSPSNHPRNATRWCHDKKSSSIHTWVEYVRSFIGPGVVFVSTATCALADWGRGCVRVVHPHSPRQNSGSGGGAGLPC